MKNQDQLTIGALAKSADVGVETIRFYERKAILTQPAKTGGFRYYSQNDAKVVRLVKKLQGIGFTLDEIKDFLVFDSCCSQSRQTVRQKSLNKIQEINQKIADLQSGLKALETFANACGTDNGNNNGCHFLDCFENDWACCSKPTTDEKLGE